MAIPNGPPSVVRSVGYEVWAQPWESTLQPVA